MHSNTVSPKNRKALQKKLNAAKKVADITQSLDKTRDTNAKHVEEAINAIEQLRPLWIKADKGESQTALTEYEELGIKSIYENYERELNALYMHDDRTRVLSYQDRYGITSWATETIIPRVDNRKKLKDEDEFTKAKTLNLSIKKALAIEGRIVGEDLKKLQQNLDKLNQINLSGNSAINTAHEKRERENISKTKQKASKRMAEQARPTTESAAKPVTKRLKQTPAQKVSATLNQLMGNHGGPAPTAAKLQQALDAFKIHVPNPSTNARVLAAEFRIIDLKTTETNKNTTTHGTNRKEKIQANYDAVQARKEAQAERVVTRATEKAARVAALAKQEAKELQDEHDKRLQETNDVHEKFPSRVLLKAEADRLKIEERVGIGLAALGVLVAAGGAFSIYVAVTQASTIAALQFIAPAINAALGAGSAFIAANPSFLPILIACIIAAAGIGLIAGASVMVHRGSNWDGMMNHMSKHQKVLSGSDTNEDAKAASPTSQSGGQGNDAERKSLSRSGSLSGLSTLNASANGNGSAKARAMSANDADGLVADTKDFTVN